MKKLIVGNWKMNTTRTEAVQLVTALRDQLIKGADAFDMAVCPPFVWLGEVAQICTGSALKAGAQDCGMADKGAFTGDVSATMVKEVGASYVIVGHSERRAQHNETNAIVKAKAEAAIKNGLIPIICVGETESERQQGAHESVVGQQLAESLPGSGAYVVAYEPVWAIGTGKTPTIQDIKSMHSFIRQQLDPTEKVAILYGGSVKPDNAAAFIAIDHVGGFLIGGASLKADEFWAIAQSC